MQRHFRLLFCHRKCVAAQLRGISRRQRMSAESLLRILTPTENVLRRLDRRGPDQKHRQPPGVPDQSELRAVMSDGSSMAAVGGASRLWLMCLHFLLLPAAVGAFQSQERECAFSAQHLGAEPYDALANELPGVVGPNGTIRCRQGSRCFGLWQREADGGTRLVRQGCWLYIGDQQECHGDRCLVMVTPSHIQNGSFRFCCCSSDLCNRNFTEVPPTTDTPALRLKHTEGHTNQLLFRREETALIALLTVAIAAVVVVVLFLGYRVRRGKQRVHLSAVMETTLTDPAPVHLENLQLLEPIGRGRYGAVFRGALGERCLAVKVFRSAEPASYANERSLYELPLMQHDNIAHFLGAGKRTAADGHPEFLILMEYYPQGCLSHFLSVHTVDWLTCCRMTHGVTRGLAFLHAHMWRADQWKPPVVHRDVSSSNVLVRDDLSCVVTDFGLSMMLTGNTSCRRGDEDTTTISEVGTVRYMAPEVLGGAVNLRDCESALKQVDMYALGLLYWESFRRCSDLFPDEATPEYQLAFQEELGNHPSFEEMQVLVYRDKYRPGFPDAWKNNSLGVSSLKDTMDDCWDQDAEARLTAEGAEERLQQLMLLRTPTALRNHRNVCRSSRPPPVGSAPSYIEDVRVDLVKNLHGDALSVVRTTADGAQEAKRNSNLIFDQQQAQVFSSSSVSPPTALNTINECGPPGGLQTVGCLQRVQENLPTCTLESREAGGGDGPSLSSLNLPQRPKSLNLSKANEGSSLLKLEKLRSSDRKVETGVAKMNVVAAAQPAEPHLLTIATNPPSARGTVPPGLHFHIAAGSKCSAGVPTVVRTTMGDSQTNAAGPVEGSQISVLTCSPDEYEPLLRREQPPAQREDLPGCGPNTNNNNNNRLVSGSEVNLIPAVNLGQSTSGDSPITRSPAIPTEGPRGTDLCIHRVPAGVATALVVSSSRDPAPHSDPPLAGSSEVLVPEARGTLVPSEPTSYRKVVNAPAVKDPSPEGWRPEVGLPPDTSVQLEPSSGNLDPEVPPVKHESSGTAIPAPAPEPAFSCHSQSIVQPQLRLVRSRRSERPCSLDLSGSWTSSENPALTEGSLSTTGEKIRRRVKTPYNLKKWRPASWVVSTDTGFDPDLNVNSWTQLHLGPQSVLTINQSKSSMAVFLDGGGRTTAGSGSEPDGLTCF